MPGKLSAQNPTLHGAAKLSVAPMMDWTDRHCRFFHRQLSHFALLYTEMVTAAAVLHGDRDRMLGFDPNEHPVALQLGGSDPKDLAQATAIASDFGYDEINLNCGCPSDRVQSGAFGAVLMENAPLVADCVAAMQARTDKEITVKCRLGVDNQCAEEILPVFIEKIRAAGVRRLTIHARKAWLQGLSPKENRDIPPLDYALVKQMKVDFPDLHISINGGISSLAQAKTLLDQGLDGVMIGRAAYHQPVDVLGTADSEIFGETDLGNAESAVLAMLPYVERHLGDGGRLNQVTRHMLGAFAGKPGARRWRRHLAENAHLVGAGPEVVLQALNKMRDLAGAETRN